MTEPAVASEEPVPPTRAETAPIRVHEEAGGWQVDYGSYAQSYHHSRQEAIEKATVAATREDRELTIEDAKTPSD
jgi:outer membrane biogenesis lipoprotein LolB